MTHDGTKMPACDDWQSNSRSRIMIGLPAKWCRPWLSPELSHQNLQDIAGSVDVSVELCVATLVCASANGVQIAKLPLLLHQLLVMVRWHCLPPAPCMLQALGLAALHRFHVAAAFGTHLQSIALSPHCSGESAKAQSEASAPLHKEANCRDPSQASTHPPLCLFQDFKILLKSRCTSFTTLHLGYLVKHCHFHMDFNLRMPWQVCLLHVPCWCGTHL